MIKKLKGLWMGEAFQIGWVRGLKIWNIANMPGSAGYQIWENNRFF
ncbi:MAG: hypothetical protein J0L56_17315 [Chitinophagales bacterium]|nr:hypothetical protein [Chitinophagales bacterium]